MNEFNNPDNGSRSPWSANVPRAKVTEASAWPDSNKIVPAAEVRIDGAVQGAHDTVDRLASTAAPMVRQLGDDVAAAKEVLHEKADQLRHTRDEWAQGMRTTVRRKPLACIAGAFALGFVVARITR